MAEAMIRAGLNTPRTSSVGRLFDTVAALCGFSGKMSFEGQAAMDLEAKAWRARGVPRPGEVAPVAAEMLDGGYPFPFEHGVWDATALLAPLLHDLERGTAQETVALRFHAALARGVTRAVERLVRRHRMEAVVLTGGVFQNRLLHELTVHDLRTAGFAVWWNEAVPPGDGGIALGQAALAAAQGEHG
jgi:hydrogenase maturation protein HypF